MMVTTGSVSDYSQEDVIQIVVDNEKYRIGSGFAYDVDVVMCEFFSGSSFEEYKEAYEKTMRLYKHIIKAHNSLLRRKG